MHGGNQQRELPHTFSQSVVTRYRHSTTGHHLHHQHLPRCRRLPLSLRTHITYPDPLAPLTMMSHHQRTPQASTINPSPSHPSPCPRRAAQTSESRKPQLIAAAAAISRSSYVAARPAGAASAIHGRRRRRQRRFTTTTPGCHARQQRRRRVPRVAAAGGCDSRRVGAAVVAALHPGAR